MPYFSRRATFGLISGGLASAGGFGTLSGCATAPAGAAPDSDAAFATLARAAMDDWIRLNPVNATQLGDHRFDGEVDDLSATGRAARGAKRREVLAGLDGLDRAGMSPAAQVDAAMLSNQMRFETWADDSAESWAWDPLPYQYLIGQSLYGLMAREYAPLPERLLAATSRMEKLPETLAQARASLDPARVPRVHADTLARQNPGNASTIDDMVLARAEILQGADRERLRAAAAKLKDELTAHQAWIEQVLVPNARGDFRLGAKLYDEKLALSFDTPLSRQDIKRDAEAALERVRAEMAEIAGKIVSPPANERWSTQRMIAAAIARVAEERPARADVVAACEASLQNATNYVRANNLITLPDAPVQVIVMPEYQRGVAVAYCDAPGPLDRDQPTFYTVSPIPDDWSEEQATSFLKEYNSRSINELTVHEAMPGHYVQLWHSNRYPSLVRAALGSGSFIEGWACYAQDMMLAEGYQDHNPYAQLTNLKWAARVITNALIDQAIHVDGLAREDAMRMMLEGAFQEEREASGKWIRASVSSAQLSTYFIGWTEHHALRRETEQRWGASFNLKRYHDTALSFGSPPVRHVRSLMFGEQVAM